MKITKLQYKALKIYRRLDKNGFTILQVLRDCWCSWLLLAIMATFFYVGISPETQSVCYLFIGLCLGAFLRDIGRYQVAFRIWPVTKQILDWKRVSELIESYEAGKNKKS